MNLYLRNCIFAATLTLHIQASAQVNGGQQVFQFLTLAPSARVTALGSAVVTVKDDDLPLAYSNPAALNPSMSGRLSFNHEFYLAGIQHGYFCYGKYLRKTGMTFHAGLQYMKYGEIKQADEYGLVTGKVKAAETALTIGAGRKLTDRLSLGLNLHLANSTLDTYTASAIAADAGLLYADSASRLAVALVLKNKGSELSSYANKREDLPFDLQLGISKRLRYLPFRIGLLAHHLQAWNIRYDDPNAVQEETLVFGETTTKKKGTPALDNFFRHLAFNGEFLLGRNESFRLRFGYNHLRKKELSVANLRSLAGFSGGVGIKAKRIRIDMGYAAYHLAGGTLHFSVGTNLGEFFK